MTVTEEAWVHKIQVHAEPAAGDLPRTTSPYEMLIQTGPAALILVRRCDMQEAASAS